MDQNNPIHVKSKKYYINAICQRNSSFDIFLDNQDNSDESKILRMLNVNDPLMICGPFGEWKYLGNGKFYKKRLQKLHNFKKILIIAEGIRVSSCLTLINTEAQIEDWSEAVDIRLLYLVENKESV